MRIDWIRVAGLATTLLIILVFSMLIGGYKFLIFDYAGLPAELVKTETAGIGPAVSRFLWTYRLIDLLAQAFVLFAAAACCVAVLRAEEKKK